MLVSLTRPSLQILNKTQAGVFPISGFLFKSLINKNCHSSRTSDDIDMKLGPVTKLDKRNTTKSKKFDDYVVSANYDVIVIFLIYGRFGPIRNLDSGRMVYDFHIFINSNTLSYKK